MSKFPKTLFAKREEDRNDHYFVTNEDPNPFAEIGVKTKVGVYVLTETIEVQAVIETKTLKGAK